MKKVLINLLGLYLFFIPWDGYFLLELNFPFSPSFIFLGLISFVAMIYILNQRHSLYFGRFLIYLFILLILATISLLWSIEEGAAIRSITIWSYFATIIIFIFVIQKSNISTKPILIYYIFGVLSVGIYSYIINPVEELSRFSIGEEFNPSWYAAFLAWAIVVSINILRNSDKIIGKIFSVFLLGLFSIMLALTQGRNAILSLVLAIPFAALFYFTSFSRVKDRTLMVEKSSLKKLIKAFFLGMLLFGLITMLILYSGIYEELHRVQRIPELMGGDLDRATAGRATIWLDYFEILRRHPNLMIFGSGIGAADDYIIKYFNLSSSSPHNTYLRIFVEYGFLGLFIWIVFLVKLILYSIDERNKNFTLIWLSFVFVFFGIGNDIIYYKYWWIGLLIFILLDDKYYEQYKNGSK